MLLAVGTRVKFLHTKDEGVVTELLDNGMVNVQLTNSDMVIPVFASDLVRYEDPFSKPSVKAKFVPGKSKPVEKRPERPVTKIPYTILKSYGIQLAFDPIYKEGLNAEKYKIYLINDTAYDVIFSLIRSQILRSPMLNPHDNSIFIRS